MRGRASAPIILPGMKEAAFQECIDPDCARTFAIDEVLHACPECGSLLDVRYDWDRARPPKSLKSFEEKYARRRDPLALSGVWRFKELLDFCPDDSVLTIGEGQTVLRPWSSVARYVGLGEDKLFLQYEGLNPSGSFKDNGMTAAFSHAKMVGARVAPKRARRCGVTPPPARGTGRDAIGSETRRGDWPTSRLPAA